MNEQSQCNTCPVRERVACAALGPADRAELARLGTRRRVRKGATVFSAGEGNDQYATLLSGALKVASFGEDGTERLLSLIHPAGFVGEMFAPVANHDVIALTDSDLCVFGRSEYERALDRFPNLAKALLKRSAQDLLEARSLIALQSRRGARARVAAFLLSMARAAGHSAERPAKQFALPLSRGEIAALLGITIETLSRQLTSLECDGAIRRQGARGIDLLEPALLEQTAR